MDILQKESFIDAFLSYMKKSAEEKGVTIEHAVFNFTPSQPEKYPRTLSDILKGADLDFFKIESKISNEDFKVIFNYCITNQYIKRYSIGEQYSVQLTDKGFDRAKKRECEEIIQNKLQEELIYIKTEKSHDSQVNDLLLKAKKAFLEDDFQLALEKVWDAFERVKTLMHTDKKMSISQICTLLADDIDFTFFDNEYRALTYIGNNYQVRHFETDKKPIKNIETKKYLFFRALSLINLTLVRIQNAKK